MLEFELVSFRIDDQGVSKPLHIAKALGFDHRGAETPSYTEQKT
tara:strand:- start:274 stop:405 length:132 start_codon:yes stop_codon:yes gene_type:complete